MSSETRTSVMPIACDFQNWNPERVTATLEKVKKMVSDEISLVVTPMKPEERTFDNTLLPLIRLDVQTGPESIFYLIFNFFPDEALRNAAKEASEELSKFHLSQTYNPDLYTAVQDYANNAGKTDSLTGEEQRYLEHTLRDLKRHGLHLSEGTRKRVEEIKKRLVEMRTSFSFNLNKDDTHYYFTTAQLNGMPDSWFQDEKKQMKTDETGAEVETGKWKVTLKYPDYLPAMQYCHSNAVREELWRGYNSRARAENEPLMNEAFKLREELGGLLGYRTYADYVTEVKIIKNGSAALEFLHDLNEKFDPVYREEKATLLKFAQDHPLYPCRKNRLHPWDMSFYQRLYKETLNEVDSQEVRKYFPLETVKKGMFKIYQQIFDLRFDLVETENRWHKEVELYRISDGTTGQEYGHFYLDLHPRDGKYGHAAVFTIYPGCEMSRFNDTYQRRGTVSAMACNFPRDEPLMFKQVVTLFHEFGHLVHHICSFTQLPDFNGHGVERDFVEAPSQMLEFWCYNLEPLQMMSAHVETGEPITSELVEKLKKYENTLQGHFNKRQISFGIFDLVVHSQKYDGMPDCNQMWAEVYKRVNHEATDLTTCFPATFGHIMGGYEAGYYGYLLAESYAANMYYHRFRPEGLLNPKVGIEYRDTVLKPGSTKDGSELLEDFLGRKPDLESLLMAKGQLPEPSLSSTTSAAMASS